MKVELEYKELALPIMSAMVMEKPEQPLQLKKLEIPTSTSKQVLIEVIACGVYQTDVHIMGGELNPHERHPFIPIFKSLGSADCAFGGQSNAKGCERIPELSP
ncbi:hypothetical protein [Pedobacter mucosus]|uniref:hypothetical protein n=1 Tax=Pedobacter mucosus TaxID=2895286 RepID=UPI001EE3BD05|nr:hypothetical protein [Pedobacter mucosus]UKT64728.1 hypothetical protein LOK61_02875 [Pedobacter mucosus]